MIEPMTSLAIAMYSGKGVHALLLGSGISRSSGIPTGWDIVLDLIRKVAAVEAKDCEPAPEVWYAKTYGKEPDYSELLEKLALTSTERMQLLRKYFEPSEEDREEKKKAPTLAHHAIAKLVTEGYIRVIITTNFDRLMEQALEAAGIQPSVISSTNDIKGAEPLAQCACTIIKVHGDYRDTRLKNTLAEIGRYDAEQDRLLDQVFDEYGLIVCGWSADWDVALRAAIERCPNRRYTTYWSANSDVAGAAKLLCDKRAAQIVKGMGADQFFGMLAEKITALKEMGAGHPLSSQMAVATLKKLLVEDKDRIRLHDFVTEESENAAQSLFGNLGTSQRTFSLKQYEARLQILLAMMVTAGFWGRAIHRKLWLDCFRQLVTPRSRSLPGFAGAMDYYPAYVALYAFGLAAIAGGRSGNLGYILAKAKVRTERGHEDSLIHRLISQLRGRELDDVVRNEEPKYKHIAMPSSHYLMDTVREHFRKLASDDNRYRELFNRFEYLMSLAAYDIYQKEDGGGFRVVGGPFLSSRTLPGIIQQEIDEQQDRWPFLKAGLFDGSLERLKEVKAGFDAAISHKNEFGY